MRFGLFYEHQLPRVGPHGWEPDAEQRLLGQALDQIELADRLGFDYVWEVEHHFLEEYSHSSAPEVFLAAASQRTSRIRLGHGIVQLPPAVNHPARVAERAATLDLLSGGRLDLGTGEGSSQVELGGFGVPREAKREQWDEALDVVVRMLTEEPFTGHHGTWVDVPPRNVLPKPAQRPHPPLWVACSRRETIELAAHKGLGALSFSFVEPEDAKPWVDAYHDILTSDRCVATGEAVNPNLAVVLPMMLHPDEQTAIDRGIDGAHFFGYSLAHYYVFGEHRPGGTRVWDEFDRYRHERGFAREIISAEREPLGMKVLQEGVGSLRGAVGTPDQVAELLDRYRDAGVDQVIFVLQAGANRHEHVCESLELFADRVLPRFAEGREEREAAKRERLAPAVAAAEERGRRRRERVREQVGALPREQAVSTYVVSPGGELRPAPEAGRVRGHGAVASIRDEVLERVRGGLSRLTARADDERLRRLGSRPGVLRFVFGGMVRGVDPDDLDDDLDATVQWVLDDGATQHHWALRVAGGRVGVRETRVGSPDVTFRAGMADFLRVFSGELELGRAIMDERLVIEGDVATAARVGALLGDAGFY